MATSVGDDHGRPVGLSATVATRCLRSAASPPPRKPRGCRSLVMRGRLARPARAPPGRTTTTITTGQIAAAALAAAALATTCAGTTGRRLLEWMHRQQGACTSAASAACERLRRQGWSELADEPAATTSARGCANDDLHRWRPQAATAAAGGRSPPPPPPAHHRRPPALYDASASTCVNCVGIRGRCIRHDRQAIACFNCGCGSTGLRLCGCIPLVARSRRRRRHCRRLPELPPPPPPPTPPSRRFLLRHHPRHHHRPPPPPIGACLCGARTFHTGGAIPNWGAAHVQPERAHLGVAGGRLQRRTPDLEGICCDPAPPPPPSPPSSASSSASSPPPPSPSAATVDPTTAAARVCHCRSPLPAPVPAATAATAAALTAAAIAAAAAVPAAAARRHRCRLSPSVPRAAAARRPPPPPPSPPRR